jgi:hypothetical protein
VSNSKVTAGLIPSFSARVSPSMRLAFAMAVRVPVAFVNWTVWQLALHVPQALVLPSSQVSSGSLMPFPHVRPVRASVALHAAVHRVQVAVP